ncbi:MAG: ribosome silencing factor [Legionellaceae bacterium]|nr:ribosome silencing factor [Legionellaceae bacterium]
MPNRPSELSTLIKALEDIQATDIVVLDVREQTTITDFMIVCSGRASRHVKAIADNIIPLMKANGLPVVHLSGVESGEWILVDLGDFVLHVMQPQCREFYNLEGLWQDSIIKNDQISES